MVARAADHGVDIIWTYVFSPKEERTYLDAIPRSDRRCPRRGRAVGPVRARRADGPAGPTSRSTTPSCRPTPSLSGSGRATSRERAPNASGAAGWADVLCSCIAEHVVDCGHATPGEEFISAHVGDSVDEAYEEAKRRGYEIVHPLIEEASGLRRFFVRAPDGNVINVASHSDEQGRPAAPRRAGYEHSGKPGLERPADPAGSGPQNPHWGVLSRKARLPVPRASSRPWRRDGTLVLVVRRTWSARSVSRIMVLVTRRSQGLSSGRRGRSRS